MRKGVYSRLQKVNRLKLSVLICTVPERLSELGNLIDELNYQVVAGPVEFLYFGDNKRRSVGTKRNDLLTISRAPWICYVDDDDSICDLWVKIILGSIDQNPEKKVICFRGTQTTNGKEDLPFRFDRKYTINHRVVNEGPQFRGMMPNHLCIWKREVAIQVKFPDINLSEDHRWATAMRNHYTEADQVLLTESLYHYRFDKQNSQCRR